MMACSDNIKHVFVLMFENRSFDHLLGFSNISGTDPITGQATTIDGLKGDESNIDTGGVAFTVNKKAHFSMKHDPGHEFTDVLEQLCETVEYTHGNYPPITNGGFIKNYAKVNPGNPSEIMNCFDPANLKVINQLANEFVVCDNWFSAIPGPTWPNRFYMHAASSAGLEDSPAGFRIITSEVGFYYDFPKGTIYDKFANPDDYMIYSGDVFPQAASINRVNNFKKFEDFDTDLMDPNFSYKYIFIEPNYDCLTGHYENGNSMHPLCNILHGEKLLKQVYEYIRKSPHWESSVLIVTCDEHGGFYDHVKPPIATAPGDVIGTDHKFDFQQYGIRVPGLIISPLIAKNQIDHTIYDHTSILATVEKIFNLNQITYRDANANDFCHLFSLDIPRQDTPILLTDPIQTVSGAGGGESSTQAEEMIRKPADRSVMGFLEIGLLTYFKKFPDADKSNVFTKYNNFLTNTDVQNFLLDVNNLINAKPPQEKVNEESNT